MSLVERIRRGRESQFLVDGITVTLRRPTDLELYALKNTSAAEMLGAFVVGWQGVNEADIVPGGDPLPAPFDAAVFCEWAALKRVRWMAVVNELWRSYSAYKESIGEELGKPGAG